MALLRSGLAAIRDLVATGRVLDAALLRNYGLAHPAVVLVIGPTLIGVPHGVTSVLTNRAAGITERDDGEQARWMPSNGSRTIPGLTSNVPARRGRRVHAHRSSLRTRGTLPAAEQSDGNHRAAGVLPDSIASPGHASPCQGRPTARRGATIEHCAKEVAMKTPRHSSRSCRADETASIPALMASDPSKSAQSLPTFVAAAFGRLDLKRRARLLGRLLGSVGPLALAVIGGGAFVKYLPHARRPVVPVSLEDAARATSYQVYDLVRYVEQSNPNAIEGVLSALLPDGMAMTALGASLAATAIRHVSERDGPRAALSPRGPEAVKRNSG